MSVSLYEVLGRVAKQMALEFESSTAIQHNPSKGTVRESSVQQFLEKHLSSVARVTGSGEIVAIDGQTSGQCDVIVVDAETPPFYADGGYVIVPTECCYAVIEVKSNLTVDELRKSWTAAKKAKSLPRTAFRPDPGPISYTRKAYGREWDSLPFIHLVFGYTGATLDTLGAEFARLGGETAPELGVDAVCVLNRGVLGWRNLVSGTFFARDPTSLVFGSIMEPGNVLLFMMVSLQQHIASARLNPKLDISKYATKGFGKTTHHWLPDGTPISLPVTVEPQGEAPTGGQ